MIQRMLAIWSLVPLPLGNPVCTSGSSQFMSCWILIWRLLSITLLAHEMSTIVWWFEHYLAKPLHGSQPCHCEGICQISETMNHAMKGHPRWMDRCKKSWQNVVHRKRTMTMYKWQCTPVIPTLRTSWALWKGKTIWHQKMSPLDYKVSNVILGERGGQLLGTINSCRMYERLGQSRNNTQLSMCLVLKVKFNTIKNNIA